MTDIAVSLLLLGTFLLAWFATGQVLSFAKQRLVDHPNERSAHQEPTPRGGGMAFLIAFLAALAILAAGRSVDPGTAAGLGGSGLLVGLVGWVDDHRHVAARWRLMAHFLAAAWLLFWLDGLPGAGALADLGMPMVFPYLIAAILIVWAINLYNFMDGIDGIASIEAICAAAGGAAAAWMAGQDELVIPCLLLAAAVAGFLPWNWPPAKIFMGDVGSGFLGILLAGLAIASSVAALELLFAWIILVAAFVTDSGVTLLRRALRRERLYEAHGMHAYQHAARHFAGHRQVTLAVAAINCFFLIPVALWVASGGLSPVLGLAIAYLPLIGLVIYWNAGQAEPFRR